MEITVISDEIQAISYAMEYAIKGSFIVVCSDGIQKSIEFITEIQQQTQQKFVNEF